MPRAAPPIYAVRSLYPSKVRRKTGSLRAFTLCVPVMAMISLLVAPAWSDTVFKSREPGKTTFSQYPPVDAAEKTNLTEIEVEGDLGGVPVRRDGVHEYCGGLQLPSSAEYGRTVPKGVIEERLFQWTSEKAEVEENISKTVESKNASDLSYLGANAATKNQRSAQYRDALHGLTRSLREYKCAITWAEGKLQSQASGATPELVRLENVRERLLAIREEACGAEPPLDPSSNEGHQASIRWKQCSASYTERLHTVDQEIKRVSVGH